MFFKILNHPNDLIGLFRISYKKNFKTNESTEIEKYANFKCT